MVDFQDPVKTRAIVETVLRWLEDMEAKPPFYAIRALTTVAEQHADALEGKGDWQVVPKEFIEFVKNAPVSSGLCMCGESENHGFSDHSPVEMWSYHLNGWLKQFAAAKERGND